MRHNDRYIPVPTGSQKLRRDNLKITLNILWNYGQHHLSFFVKTAYTVLIKVLAVNKSEAQRQQVHVRV
jgi:hypothetical protein